MRDVGSSPTESAAGGKTVRHDDETSCCAGMQYDTEPYHGLVLNRKPAIKSAGVDMESRLGSEHRAYNGVTY